MNVSVSSKISGDHLVFRMRASAVGEAAAERSLHIGILLDNSGSMEGERLESVKRTLRSARSLLRFGDHLTVVSFSDTAAIHLRAHALSDAAAIEAAYTRIDNIHAETSTNLGAGLEMLYDIATDYDAVILLTDGMVNAGITSTAGLRAMAQAGGPTLTFHTIGYGADHNRTLLRELAVRSRGTYTYADSDEILPLAVGDIVSGLRAEVARGVRLSLPSECGWTCQEMGAENLSGYYVGNIVADRDYWAVFHAVSGGGVASGAGVLMAALEMGSGGENRSVSVGAEGESPISDQDMEDQVLRVRVAAALEVVSGQLEAGGSRPNMSALQALQTELEGLPVRPLLMRLRAQVAEVLEIASRMSAAATAAATPRANMLRSAAMGVRMGDDHLLRTHLMARMSSGVACLGNQRGVYSMAPAEGEEDTNTSFFSTPTQRTASNVVRATYAPHTDSPAATIDPDVDAPNEPIGLRTPTPQEGVPMEHMEEID